MKDKNGIEIKCENCEYRKPCLECATCENGGFKPKGKALEARIAELEAENAELKDHISKSEKMVDVRKLVKPLVWEYDEDDEIYSAPISPRCRKFLQVSVFCEKMKSGFWRVCTDCIVCDRKTPEEAKEAAQDWLVSLVANVCGLESEVQNG